MVLEVMGRYAGWIALHGGLGGSADAILIPEIPFSYERLAAFVDKRMGGGAASTMIVVAEGARGPRARILPRCIPTPRARPAWAASAHRSRTRSRCAPGARRGRWCWVTCSAAGAPTTLDRILGTRFGVGAIQLIQDGKFGHMVSYLNYQIGAVTIKEAVGQLKVRAAHGPDGRDGQGDGHQLRDLGEVRRLRSCSPRKGLYHFLDSGVSAVLFMKHLLLCGLAVVGASFLSGCSAAPNYKYLVVFSQCNNAEPYRSAQNEEMKEMWAKQPDVKLVEMDAQQDSVRQIAGDRDGDPAQAAVADRRAE